MSVLHYKKGRSQLISQDTKLTIDLQEVIFTGRNIYMPLQVHFKFTILFKQILNLAVANGDKYKYICMYIISCNESENFQCTLDFCTFSLRKKYYNYNLYCYQNIERSVVLLNLLCRILFPVGEF